jgi:hypothetical protein
VGGSRGTGGASNTGGVGAAGGGFGTGGARGSGGATLADAAPTLDVGIDSRPPDTRADADAQDAPLPMDTGREDAPFSLDTARIDLAIDRREASGDATPPACAAAGGFCTRYAWESCPAHYEPTALEEGHLDCSGSSGNAWCCVPAPSSPCSDTGAGNCLVGDTCTGCWAEAPSAPACEAGRVCCMNICN